MSARAYNELNRSREPWARRGKPLGDTVRRGELLIAGVYAAVALAIALSSDLDNVPFATAAFLCVALAVAANVRFDVGAGYTVATQAVFVPMLFALPVAMIPLVMPLALALGMSPRVARGEIAPSWLLMAVGNSWFVIGPVLVFTFFSPAQALYHQWPVLLLALGAQLAFDFANSAARECLYGVSRVHELLAECTSTWAVDFTLSTLGLAIAYAAGALHSQLALLLVAPLFGILLFFSRERRERLSQLAELNDAYQGTALLLGDVVEADDYYTGEHCKSVVRVALEVAERLELDAHRKRNVELGALLHDVGKIAVPKEIINKRGKLDEREWAIIKTHTIEGQRMLERIGGLMLEIGRIVRASHERWDGTGYPDGLHGEHIPLEARIIATCDAFNAMTTTRSYRAAMDESIACEELRRCAGTQFDPTVVQALLSLLKPQQGADGAEQTPDGNDGAQVAEHGFEPEQRFQPEAGGAWGTIVSVARPIVQ